MKNVADEATQRLFSEAGISRGMKVLEVGCAVGRLTSVIAEVVGSEGSVVGVDKNEKSLEIAREQLNNTKHVSFVQGDLERLSMDGEFDAIVGRRVFMYLADPGGAIKNLVPLLKPNGVFAIQEHSCLLPMVGGSLMPIHQKYAHMAWETVRREGGDIQIGPKLWSYLTEGGIQVEDTRAEYIIQTPSVPYPYAQIFPLMKGRILANNVASEDELNLEGLEERLKEERDTAQTMFVSDVAFCLWGRKQA